MIPPIIHQTWKDREVPPRFRAACASWKDAHPGWEHLLWTDQDLFELVRRKAPSLMPLYERYPDHIQRVDAARYVILREFGGIYADLDVHCLRSFEDFRGEDAGLPRTIPLGLSNQLMFSRPGHPLFDGAVKALPRAFERWQHAWIPRHFRILCSTGPLFITGCYHRMGNPDCVRILSLAEHGLVNAVNPPPYVRHLPGDTWAEWDTHVFNFLLHQWRWIAMAGSASAGLTFLM